MQQLIKPPSNINAEASLLGCLLLKGNLFEITEETGLLPDDFYELRHKYIYKAIKELFEQGKTPDIITVSEQLKIYGELDNIGGISFLEELTNITLITTENAIKEYSEIIIENAMHRAQILICNEAIERSYKQESEFQDILDKATSDLMALGNRKQDGAVKHIREVVDQEIVKLKERIEDNRTILGISCGYHMLDTISSGFKPGDMIVLAGRPGMGKTSFALNMAIEIAKQDLGVLFYSLEMPAAQLINRIIATECSINSQNFLTGRMEPEELSRLWNHIDTISRMPIYIDDTSSLTISDLRSKAKKLKAELIKSGKDLHAVFVDYLQLMNSNVFKDDRVRQVEHNSRGIKLFAKELGLPIVALAQLSRKVEDRTSKVPLLSDLRDSGAIEQDADMVMFIHREDMYNKETENKGMAEIHVQKNRHGQTGSVKLRFIAHYTKFGNIDLNAEDNYDI